MIEKLIRLRKNVKNWYLRPLERYGLAGKEITYHLRNGLRFTFASVKNWSSLWIVEEMLIKHPYNNEKVVLKKGDIVIDIGGNCGAFSILQAKLYEGIVIHAYEPDPDNFKYLEMNIEQNGYQDSITAHEYAVTGKSAESLELHKSAVQAGAHSAVRQEGGETITVPAVSLSAILKDYPEVAFLKIDCEGGEYDILLNTPKELFSKVKYIAMEYHTVEGNSVDELTERLTDMDFTVLKSDEVPNILQCFNKRLYSKK